MLKISSSIENLNALKKSNNFTILFQILVKSDMDPLNNGTCKYFLKLLFIWKAKKISSLESNDHLYIKQN